MKYITDIDTSISDEEKEILERYPDKKLTDYSLVTEYADIIDIHFISDTYEELIDVAEAIVKAASKGNMRCEPASYKNLVIERHIYNPDTEDTITHIVWKKDNVFTYNEFA